MGTRDVRTQSARAQFVRAQPVFSSLMLVLNSCPVPARDRVQSMLSLIRVHARVQFVPSSCPVLARVHAQSVPSLPLPKPCHRLTDQVN